MKDPPRAKKIMNYYIGFNSSSKELEESVSGLKLQAWIVLRKKIDEELADTMLLMKMRSRYNSIFTCFLFLFALNSII